MATMTVTVSGTTKSAMIELQARIDARFGVIAVQSFEERRVADAVLRVTTGTEAGDADVWTWTLSDGLRPLRTSAKFSAGQGGGYLFPTGATLTSDECADVRDPIMLLRLIRQWPVRTKNPAKSGEVNMHPTIFVLNGFWQLVTTTGGELRDPMLGRLIRDANNELSTESANNIVIVDGAIRVPPEIEKDLSLIDWPLPDENDREAIVARTERAETEAGRRPKLNGGRDRLISALAGLTEIEAENALAYAIIRSGGLNDAAIRYVTDEKQAIIRKAFSGNVEFVERIGDGDLGGHDRMQAEIPILRSSFSVEARRAGVEPFSAWLLIGPPGTGKTTACKLIAGDMMTVIKADVGRMKSQYVGVSEQNFMRLYKTAIACAPCLVILDEIGRMFNMRDGAFRDSGVTDSLLSILLDAMTRPAGVFFAATANDPTGLPSELIARFDRIWLVDAPSEKERVEIFRIHLNRRGIPATDRDLARFAEATSGYVGREIERIAKNAKRIAYSAGRAANVEDVMAAIKGVRPISQITPDKFEAMQQFGYQYGAEFSSSGDRLMTAENEKKGGRKLSLRRDSLN